MKRSLCVFIACVLLCGLMACNQEPVEKPVNYAVAISNIDKAMEYISDCFDNEIGSWDYFLSYCFYDSEPEKWAGRHGAEDKGRECINYRTNARNCLATAKTTIQGGSGDIFTAVQKYYLAVSECLHFVSTYPQGYSKLTWTSAWASLKTKVSSAAVEVEFYR